MTRYALVLLCLLTASSAFGQTEGWLKIETGPALYLDPYQATWMPLSDRQQVSLHAFLLTEAPTQATLFHETEAFALPPAAYVYLADVLPRTRIGVVEALTRIETAQLPVNTNTPGQEAPPIIGLTYGYPLDETPSNEPIPYAAQRDQAVEWFYAQGRLDAALLSLKRTMTKYPDLYVEVVYVERLFRLYHELALYGFLLDEAKKLTQIRVSEPFDGMVHQWYEVAKNQLIIQE